MEEPHKKAESRTLPNKVEEMHGSSEVRPSAAKRIKVSHHDLLLRCFVRLRSNNRILVLLKQIRDDASPLAQLPLVAF
jgi:hypothetical protein